MVRYYDEDTANETKIGQFENQGLIVRNSHAVDITQTEVQGLLLIQAALCRGSNCDCI